MSKCGGGGGSGGFPVAKSFTFFLVFGVPLKLLARGGSTINKKFMYLLSRHGKTKHIYLEIEYQSEKEDVEMKSDVESDEETEEISSEEESSDESSDEDSSSDEEQEPDQEKEKKNNYFLHNIRGAEKVLRPPTPLMHRRPPPKLSLCTVISTGDIHKFTFIFS